MPPHRQPEGHSYRNLLPCPIIDREAVTQGSFDLTPRDQLQILDEISEVLMDMLFPSSEHPTDSDGQSFLLGKDPTVTIGNATKIEMDTAKILLLEMNS